MGRVSILFLMFQGYGNMYFTHCVTTYKNICILYFIKIFDILIKLQIRMRVLTISTFRFSRKYTIPYNINRQEHKKYFDQLRKAQEVIKESQKPKVKKIKLYDKPRIDRDITGYGAWRIFSYEEILFKTFQHSLPVKTRVWLQPKWLIHGFGFGCYPITNPKAATKQYFFFDNRLSQFTLFDYRQTTHYKPNKENYDYDNQQHLPPKQRISKRLSPQEFWNSQEYFGFRLNASNYGEFWKFRKWIQSECERRKSQKSYDEKITQKFGKPILYNSKDDAKHFQASKPMVLSVGPQHFQEKAKDPQVIKVEMGIRLDQKHRATQEDLKQVRTIRVRKQSL